MLILSKEGFNALSYFFGKRGGGEGEVWLLGCFEGWNEPCEGDELGLGLVLGADKVFPVNPRAFCDTVPVEGGPSG